MEMKDKYVIINKTTIQKRIEELKEDLQNEPNAFIYTSYQTEFDTLQKILSQSTPLIPEIEKAFDENKNEQPIYYEDNGCNCGQPSCTFGCA